MIVLTGPVIWLHGAGEDQRKGARRPVGGFLWEDRTTFRLPKRATSVDPGSKPPTEKGLEGGREPRPKS